MNFPTISIVTPSYNQAKYLERTILSVINQNYPNLEYIIIDGGSNDGSVEIIKKYEKHLTYWVSEKDKGQSDAHNKGFSKASGDIFAYLNSDDIYLPNTLSLVAQKFQENENIDLIYGHAKLIDSDDNKIGLCVALPFKLKEHLNGVFSIPQPSSFWRKKVYEKVGGFNLNNHSCMDAEFYALASAYNFRFKNINEILSGFRIHPLSKTGDPNGIVKSLYKIDQEKIKTKINKIKKVRVNKILQYYYRFKYIPINLFRRFLLSY